MFYSSYIILISNLIFKQEIYYFFLFIAKPPKNIGLFRTDCTILINILRKPLALFTPIPCPSLYTPLAPI